MYAKKVFINNLSFFLSFFRVALQSALPSSIRLLHLFAPLHEARGSPAPHLSSSLNHGPVSSVIMMQFGGKANKALLFWFVSLKGLKLTFQVGREL